MQISATTPPSPPPSPPSGGMAAQVRELASIFANGSTASKEQMLDAYVAYSRLRTASAWDDPAGFYKQTTQQERDAINAIVRDSAFVQQLNAAEARRAEAEERAKAERRQTPGLYRSGDNVAVDA